MTAKLTPEAEMALEKTYTFLLRRRRERLARQIQLMIDTKHHTENRNVNPQNPSILKSEEMITIEVNEASDEA